jgi:D-lactate dehydrogenase
VSGACDRWSGRAQPRSSDPDGVIHMRVAVFSTKPYDETSFREQVHAHELVFLEPRLTAETASLAEGFDCVCAFVNDDLGGATLDRLAAGGTKLLALRSAGFNHVDVECAERLGLTVARVPAYSPYAVAEHAVGMVLALNRKIHRAYNRVREGNFALTGLLGFDLRAKTVGVIGTGKIGTVFARIMIGFECRVLAADPYPSDACRDMGVEYVDRERLFRESDIIALHAPLSLETYHIVNARTVALMKPGALLVNTSRGALVNTRAVIDGLKSGRIGALGLDVYEEEGELFFRDLSDSVIHDDVFARLLTFPNVLITGHQAFFTIEALAHIAETTLNNITRFEAGRLDGTTLVTSR